MPIFEFTNTIDGDEDPIYIQAASQNVAMETFHQLIGPMPPSMLIIKEVPEVPEGHELLNP